MERAAHRNRVCHLIQGRIRSRVKRGRLGIDRAAQFNESKEPKSMLWTIAIILIVLWALGLFTHVAGGLIHLLLVIAIIVIVVNLVRGRRIL